MLYFPQLITGATSQYPIRKTHRRRTISTVSEDGHRYAIPDESAGELKWDLSFAEITDNEMAQLLSFFRTVEGRLQSFTFFDPTGNLLFWSENLDHPVWQKSSFLQMTGNTVDPLGTSRGTRLTNTGASDLALEQTINVPGITVSCFSVYARSGGGAALTLVRSSGTVSTSQDFVLDGGWRRLIFTSVLAHAAQSSTFGVRLSVTGVVELFGLQVQAQPGASTYSPSYAHGGVFPSARFDSDAITVTSTSPNRNACAVQIVTPANA